MKSWEIFVNRHPRRAGQHFRIYKHLTVRFTVAKACTTDYFHREALRAFVQIVKISNVTCFRSDPIFA